MSIRTLALGLFAHVRCAADAGGGTRAVRRDAVFRSGDRRALSHRSRGRVSGIRRRDFEIASESLGVLGTQDRRRDRSRHRAEAHQRAALRAAARPQAQVPHQLPADELQRRLDRAPRVHVQRHPLRRQPAGHDRALVEDVARSATSTTSSIAIGGSSGFVLQAKATDIQANLQARRSAPSSRARRRPIPDDRRHRARLRGAEHLDHGRARSASRFPTGIDERYQAHYFDFDLYGTVNFNDYVGAQVGFRSLDLGYVFEKTTATSRRRGSTSAEWCGTR